MAFSIAGELKWRSDGATLTTGKSPEKEKAFFGMNAEAPASADSSTNFLLDNIGVNIKRSLLMKK